MDRPEELKIKREMIALSLFDPEPITATYNVNHSSLKQESVVSVAGVATVDHWNQEPKKPNGGKRPIIRMKYSKKPSIEDVHQAERKPENEDKSDLATAAVKTELRSLDDLGLDECFNATATKLEAVKRKIHESYERCENAKKQRRIQVVELKGWSSMDPKRGGKTGVRIPIRFPGHRESVLKKIRELKRRNSSRIHSYTMYKPVIV